MNIIATMRAFFTQRNAIGKFQNIIAMKTGQLDQGHA
jgi:hypothetical protein